MLTGYHIGGKVCDVFLSGILDQGRLWAAWDPSLGYHFNVRMTLDYHGKTCSKQSMNLCIQLCKTVFLVPLLCARHRDRCCHWEHSSWGFCGQAVCGQENCT